MGRMVCWDGNNPTVAMRGLLLFDFAFESRLCSVLSLFILSCFRVWTWVPVAGSRLALSCTPSFFIFSLLHSSKSPLR